MDSKGEFDYEPKDPWDYNKIDTIQIRSETGRFTFRFIEVDSTGVPTEGQVSPVEVDGRDRNPTSLRSGKTRADGEFATGRIHIRNDRGIIEAGRRVNGNKTARYRYAIACEVNGKLFVDASKNGSWGC